MKRFFITGIGTDVGKTIISAIITEALQADYWKPVQAGGLDFTDTDYVRSLVSNTTSVFHSEAYRLSTPASPHYAAEVDNVRISTKKIECPHTNNHLVIEGAGGIMVPLNDDELMIDLMKKINVPIILVANYYLGSIHHTLASIECLKREALTIHGLIFNGKTVPSTKEIILKHSGINLHGEVPELNKITKERIKELAGKFKNVLL